MRFVVTLSEKNTLLLKEIQNKIPKNNVNKRNFVPLYTIF